MDLVSEEYQFLMHWFRYQDILEPMMCNCVKYGILMPWIRFRLLLDKLNQIERSWNLEPIPP